MRYPLRTYTQIMLFDKCFSWQVTWITITSWGSYIITFYVCSYHMYLYSRNVEMKQCKYTNRYMKQTYGRLYYIQVKNSIEYSISDYYLHIYLISIFYCHGPIHNSSSIQYILRLNCPCVVEERPNIDFTITLPD